VIFDILTRPAPILSADERAEVKRVAKDLLSRLKALLVLNWRQKSAARSQLKLAIETASTQACRVFTPQRYTKRSVPLCSNTSMRATRSGTRGFMREACDLRLFERLPEVPPRECAAGPGSTCA
jgi:hypothetical protein